MISDLIGVLYLFCFHCTYDDQVGRRNSGVRTGIQRLTVERVDTLYTVSYTHLDVYKRQSLFLPVEGRPGRSYSWQRRPRLLLVSFRQSLFQSGVHPCPVGSSARWVIYHARVFVCVLLNTYLQKEKLNLQSELFKGVPQLNGLVM